MRKKAEKGFGFLGRSSKQRLPPSLSPLSLSLARQQQTDILTTRPHSARLFCSSNHISFLGFHPPANQARNDSPFDHQPSNEGNQYLLLLFFRMLERAIDSAIARCRRVVSIDAIQLGLAMAPARRSIAGGLRAPHSS